MPYSTSLREASKVTQCTAVARRRSNKEVEGGRGQVGLPLLAGQRAWHVGLQPERVHLLNPIT